MPTPSEGPLQFQLSQDFVDVLGALNAHGAKYLVVGGYAFGAYVQPRATGDLDIWILTSDENSRAVFHALADFGAPISGMQPSDFNDNRSYFQMGEPPLRIDILQVLSGILFQDAWESRVIGVVNGDIEVPVISLDKLIENKLAAGRPKDLLDVSEIHRKAQLLKRFSPS